ncbi:MAG TPA: class I adenylate-forming enzyme family protein [Candidatus Dormibacteraeota bacterium]
MSTEPIGDGAVAASLAESCRRWADRPALTGSDRTLTYAEMGGAIAALARAYRSLGIKTGDRIVCQLPPCPEHVIAMAAAWECGAVHAGAHPDLTGPELSAVVGQVGAAALLFQPRRHLADPESPLRATRAAHPEARVIVHGRPAAAGELALAELLDPGSAKPAAAPAPPPHDLSVLLRTSGTTGLPKTVMETLPALWAKVQFFARALQPGPDDVHLMYLPVSHAFGMKLSLMALATGGHLVLSDRFSPSGALELVGRHRVTVLPATPTHLTLLLSAIDSGRHPIASLRWVPTAAAPLLPSLAAAVYQRLGVEIMNVYGCSEGFLTLTTRREDVLLGSVGRIVFRGPPGSPPDGRLAILDVERDEVLAGGVTGEIAYGADKPVRYWGEPPIASGGWYRTGDIGMLDGDGRLYVRGRLKELINRGGLKVPCAEVEAALRGVPAVADCAVIPSPDPVLGEAICACVVPTSQPAPELAAVRASLSEVLARHKLPDELCVLDEIPHTSMGKVDRSALAARVLQGRVHRTRFRPVAPVETGR